MKLYRPVRIELGDDYMVSVSHQGYNDATQGYGIDAHFSPTIRLSLISKSQLDSTRSPATFSSGRCSISSRISLTTNHQSLCQRLLRHISQGRKRTHGISIGRTSNHTAIHSSKHRFKHTSCTNSDQVHRQKENMKHTCHWIYNSISDQSSDCTSEVISTHISPLNPEHSIEYT